MSHLDLIHGRIQAGAEFERNLARWRFASKKIVFTNGCFDILHRGHIDYLSKAADLGDILIIGLNTDDSVRRLKGEGRPVNNQESRGLALASLRFVDAVVYFAEDTPLELIKLIRPDVLVKGADYAEKEIVGASELREYGGEVVRIRLVEGFSTSALIDRISGK